MTGRPRKLTPEQVREIRAWWTLRRSLPTRRQMSERFGISESLLHDVGRGVKYKESRYGARDALLGMKP